MRINQKKINLIVILICLILIGSLTLGYSILSTSLNINTEVTVRAEKDIRITAISLPTQVSNAYEVYNAKYTEDTFTSNIDLPNPDSSISYEITITNNGSAPMKVDSLGFEPYSNNYINYTFSNIKKGAIIASGDQLKFTVTFAYKNPSSLPAATTLGSVLNIDFKEYIPTEIADYIEEGILLNLEGTTAPVDNKWIDSVNNKTMTLTNVLYNESKKYYEFSQDKAWGTLGEPIIPKTADFTLETLIYTPETYSTGDDQAIVSQVSNTSNDTGRFKFGYATKKLMTFYNRQSIADNLLVNFVNDPPENTRYLLQLTRTNNNMYLYVNGGLITSFPCTSSNIISQQDFKLAYWNAAKNQYFKGKIQAVRVYNRGLTQEELTNNYQADLDRYFSQLTPADTIEEFVNTNYLATTEDGLYVDNIGNHIFRGKDPSNYLKFENDNDVYRIISLDETEHTMKIVNITQKFNIPYDESGNRNSTTSTYCNKSSTIADSALGTYFGCNAWSKDENYTNGIVTGSVNNDATSATYLNSVYYNTIPDSIKSKIIKHNFAEGYADDNSNRNEVNTKSLLRYWYGNIGTITASDVIDSNKVSAKIGASLNSYLSDLGMQNEYAWTMTASDNNTYDTYAVVNSTVSKRRSSRDSQDVLDSTNRFYIHPAFYISSTTNFSGSGIYIDPFIIKD